MGPRRIVAVLALSAFAAAAQVPGANAGHPPDPQDGGTAAPLDGGAIVQPEARAAKSSRPRPDRMRAVQADAGTPSTAEAAPARPQSDAELAALRERVRLLEQQVAASQDQSEQLQQMNQQLADLRRQMADAEAARQAERDQAAARVQSRDQAVSALAQAQAILAGGNVSDLGDALDAAESVLSGQARLDVQAARAALNRNDLYTARQNLAAAVAHAQGAATSY